MLFNSFEFILLFLPLVFCVYFALNKLRLIELAKGWLVISSLYFYSYWNINYLPLIIISMVFNYSIGSTLSKKLNFKINRKLILSLGIIGNVILLGYYKYFDFLIKNINTVFHSEFNYMNIMLPLAISFFTFQQIAYLVDSFKKETNEYDFLNYALFVTFFPQLIAGPIVHHKEMMPQFAKLRNKVINHKNISVGLLLFFIGLFKKVLIADNLSSFVHQGFDIQPTLSFLEAWFATFAYAFQLYFDFSGYADMALGIGYLFNISLPKNFNSPYKAKNIQDFWRRWHITLSRFLKDYIYIPLGGNRLGNLNTYKNLFLTFLIGGLWHGAAWTFVIWGALHGMFVAIHRAWQGFAIKMNKVIAIGLTFIFVNICWVFFRANDFETATKVLKGMLGFSGFILPKTNKLLFVFPDGMQIHWSMLIACFVLVFYAKNSNEIAKKMQPNSIYIVSTIILAYLSLANLNKISEFLYFQF